MSQYFYPQTEQNFEGGWEDESFQETQLHAAMSPEHKYQYHDLDDDIEQNFDADVTIPVVRATDDQEKTEKHRTIQVPQFNKTHLKVVLGVLGIGIILGIWFLFSRTPGQSIPMTPVTSGPDIGVPTSDGGSQPPTTENKSIPATAAASESQTKIKVHVIGAVAKPGVVTLSAGARVVDAIEAAGGLTLEANTGKLNLAHMVGDGAQIIVGDNAGQESNMSEGGVMPSQRNSSTNAPADQKLVNINTASVEQLMSLPGVGQVTATAIIKHREQNGRFRAVEQLMEVSGIGQKTFERLSPQITV